MTTNLTLLADELFPLLVPKFEDAGLVGGGSIFSGGLIPHALSGSYHTGTLSDAQAPQFLKRDGSRSLIGNLSVAPGVTIDGVDLSAFKASYDSHLISDSHDFYAHAEGKGIRPAAYAERLNKAVLPGTGILVSPGGDLTQDQTVAINPAVNIDWTGLHTWNQVTTHNGGIFLGFGDAIQFGGASAILYASGTDPDLLKTDNHLRVGGMLGINTDPSYRLHIVGSGGETLLYLDGGTTHKMMFDSGTSGAGNPNTPRVGASNYASQTTGWRIDNDGFGDLRYLYADELHVRAFIADIERALAGGQIITKSVAILNRNFIIPALSATGNMFVQDLPGFSGVDVFEDGDYIRVRVIDRSGGGLVVLDAWGEVTANPVAPVDAGEQCWIFETVHYTTSAVVGLTAEAGQVVLDYGQPPGDGYWEVTTLDPFSPYAQVVTWTTNPWNPANRVVRTRMGNLDGISDPDLNPTGWGLWGDNVYLDGKIVAREGRILDNVIIGGGTMTAQDVEGWGWGADTTYIDGNQIFTGTVNTEKLNVGLGGGNLILGANWNDDPTGGALVMPGGWNRGSYGTVNYHRLTKDTSGAITGTAGENYIEGSVATGSGTYIQSDAIAVDVNRVYTLSTYARRLSGSGTTSIGVECFNSSMSLLGYRFCTLQAMAATGAPGFAGSGGYRYSGTIGGVGGSQNQFISGTVYVKVFMWVVESSSGSSAVAIWQPQFEEGDLLTAWSPGLRANVQIDNQKIMVGTPGAQRTEMVSEGIRGYNSSNALQAIWDSTDGRIKAGGGKVEMGADGFLLRTTASDAAFFLFKDGSGATDIGTMYVYKRTSPSTKTMGLLSVHRTAGSTPAEFKIDVDSNASVISLLLDGAANSGAGEVQVLGQFRVGSSQHSFLTGGLNVGSATGAGTGTVKASGDLQCDGRVSTNGGTTLWELGTFTGSGDAISNGSVAVVINGTTYKLMTKA